MTIVADVKNSFQRVGELPVIRLFKKAADLVIPRPVLVAKPSLTGSARRLATRYHITAIEGQSFGDLMADLETFLSASNHPNN